MTASLKDKLVYDLFPPLKKKESDKILGMKPAIFELVISVLAFLLIFVSYIMIKPLELQGTVLPGAFAKGYGIFLLLILLLVGLILFFRHELTPRRVIFLLFALGFVLRLTYMLYTRADNNCRQYDTFSGNHDGHFDYALSFYLTGKLPTEHITPDTIYQFYHPPLNAFIQGMFMRGFNAIVTIPELKSSDQMLYASATILSCFYMYLTSLFFTKTVLKTNLSVKGKILAVAIVTLYPRMIQFSAQLNNDGLSVMFSAIALYYYYCWFTKGHSWKDNLLASFFIGMALFAKMSAATICLGMAVGYLIELIRSIRKKEGSLPVGKLILQYLVFLVIAAPIGLWWQQYTHSVYGLPYNFVFKNLNSLLYTGTQSHIEATRPDDLWYYDKNNLANGAIYTSTGYNIFVRYILPVYFPDFESGIFCSAFGDYNILSYALRCSIFGEFSYWHEGAQALAVPSVLFLYFVYFGLVISFFYWIFSKNRKMLNDTDMISMLVYFGMIVMFLYLQISMPYGCSMDFRYMVPIVLPAALLVAKSVDIYDEASKGKKHTVFPKFMSKYLSYSTSFFLICTSFFYLSAI